jgi:uncharacterized membrane protein YecN with MAPEG domain
MSTTLPLISAATAGVLILLQSILMLATGTKRVKHKQLLGDGGQEDLLRAVRRHGNLAENAAIFVISLALLEMIGTGAPTVAALAAVFVAARLSHALGLSFANTRNVWRVVGASLTALCGLAVGGLLLWRVCPFFAGV